MGINRISDYGSLFVNYKVPEIPSVDVPSDSPDIGLTIEVKESAKQELVDIRELSLTYNAREDFGYIGRDSDIHGLDIQKAISDMKKDQVLQQYQYFVGSSETLFPQNASEDGHVFLKF